MAVQLGHRFPVSVYLSSSAVLPCQCSKRKGAATMMRAIPAMKVLRWFFLVALALLLTPSFSPAQVAVVVRIGPPPLPIYDQPICPGEGYLWTPGYWAWDLDTAEHYWVPGTWVMVPEPGLLWTPGYWGWADAGYRWYPGYWAPQVGYYGGNGGTVARPTSADMAVERETHRQATPTQMQHEETARSNREFHVSMNRGNPPVAATSKPGVFTGPGVVPAHPSANTPSPNANRPNTQPFPEAEPNTPERPNSNVSKPPENKQPAAKPQPSRQPNNPPARENPPKNPHEKPPQPPPNNPQPQ